MRIPNFAVSYPHPYNKIGDGPEGPEVARVADALEKLIVDRTITSIVIPEKGQKNHKSLLNVELPGTIFKVTSKGKKVLLYLKSKMYPEVIIANSLMMSGYWCLEEDKYTKATFHFSEGDPIHFCSVRSFSRSHALITEEDKVLFFKKVGPDLLRESISPELWLERMRTLTVKREGSKPFLICDALIEQKIFSGVGNYIRADAMYRAAIKPDRPVNDLSDDELERLRIATCNVIQESYKTEGYTIRDFKHVDGHPGCYIPDIYGRETDDLGNIVLRERFETSKHKNRTVWWVPAVQDPIPDSIH